MQTPDMHRGRTVKTLLVVVTLALFSPIAFSHPGGIDNCGGHRYKKKGGGYHIHDNAKFCACYPNNKRCTGGGKSGPKPKSPK